MIQSIDESHWCIMEEFQTLNFFIHKTLGGYWLLKISKPLLTKYVPLILRQFFAIELFILVFGITAIIHQQLVAMQG